MLVDVVELDWHGHPRDKAEVLAEAPVRGQLRMECLWTDRALDRPRVHAELHPFKLETLYSARVERWRGVHLLLSGWQRQPAGGRQGGTGRFPQRWWVRLVLDPSRPPTPWSARRR